LGLATNIYGCILEGNFQNGGLGKPQLRTLKSGASAAVFDGLD